MSDLEALEALLRRRSLTRGDFILSSGKHSRYYIDARRTTMSAEGLTLVGKVGLQAIRAAGWTPGAIGGLTMGADPVACAIAAASAASPPLIDAFSVRKLAKDHGTRRRVEGNVGPGVEVVVVEDVITTGGSAFQAIAALEAERVVVLGVLAVVDRNEGGREALEASGHAVVALTTSTRLLA